MRNSPSMSLYDHWTQPSYVVRVRGTATPKFLWGSSVLSQNINFDKPLILHLRNDQFGEDVTFGTQDVSGTQTVMGTLHPGECVSISLQNIAGVFATCSLDSTVGCLIKGTS